MLSFNYFQNGLLMSGQGRGIFLIAVVVLFAFPCCSENKKGEKVTIAAAASMQYAIGALVQNFEVQTGIRCDLIIGSSGKLTAQILEGAPYDLLLSADMKYPSEIYKSGMALGPPATYGSGQLVLWTTKEGLQPSIMLLKDSAIDHIAIANPQTAPYGKAAMEVLSHYGLFDSLAHKLVYGESISQANQFITSKAAELGFTSMAVVLSPGLKDQGSWVALDSKSYSKIQQGVVIINRDQANFADIRVFYDYLFSKEAKILLKNYGYLVDE